MPEVIEVVERRCPRCSETKRLDTEYYRDRSQANGHSAHCRECSKVINQEQRLRPARGTRPGRPRKIVGDTAYCPMCQTYKPFVEFYADKVGRGSSYCKPCLREWYESKPHRYKRGYASQYYLIARYGITPEQYEWMLETQGGVCAICGTDKPGGKHTYFSVDHDHETGQIRGLLCSKCNIGIGYFDDNVVRLRSAISYLNNAARQLKGAK